MARASSSSPAQARQPPPKRNKKEGRGGDYRRANAPPATHIETPRLEQSFGLYLSLVQLERDYNLKSSNKLNTLVGTKAWK